ncbi:MAG: type II toxin-antitoxin system VapC family toxin [Terriglobia bacterium]
MARVLTPSGSVFLDTAYAVALASTTDAYHHRALALADELEAQHTHLVTTWGVLLEIGNALSKNQYRHAALQLISSLQRDESVEIVPLSDPLIQRAMTLYAERPDKEWGLTDCISFVVMETRGIRDALTADEHFTQAGFRPLLREVTGG